MRCLDGITDSMDISMSILWEIVKNREALQSMGSQRVGCDLATEQQQPCHFFIIKLNDEMSFSSSHEMISISAMILAQM